MKRRQTSIPRQWLITDERLGPNVLRAVRRLPRGSGVLVRNPRLLARIRRLRASRQLEVVAESRLVVRVHNAREMRDAQLAGAQVLLLSPLFGTRSHRDWLPLPRMRVAALMRLAKVPVIALGGMDERRFRAVQKLGFAGWAGIDAWLKVTKVTR
jgi:thiamine-phosphate pyrophosphorylase